MAVYNKEGQEVPDQKPVELPIGYNHPETLQQMISRMVRVYSIQAAKQELESFEEADDFETEEEEFKSSHQMTDMQEEHPPYKPSILKTDQREKKEEPKPPSEPADNAGAKKK